MAYKDKEKEKEYKRLYYREYRKNNPEQTKKARDKHRHSFDDGYHRVYLLEDYNYVGCTKNIHNRFNRHKQKHKRDCTNYRILYKSKDRKECEELEDLLHDIGYEGKHIKNRRNYI
tara:strand:- start:136 stop:483 length:348 start_codon:yes stop_codon:yes gene_type:complete